MKIPRIVRTAVGWGVVVLVGWLFYVTLRENWSNLDGISLGIDVWIVLVALAFIAAVAVSGWLWGLLLGDISRNQHITHAEAVRVHSLSWLLKYIPGQVSSYVNKILWGTQHGFSKKSISTSFVYENVLMVIAGFALSLPVLVVVAGGQDWSLVFAPLLLVTPMLLVLNRRTFLFVLNTFARLLRRSQFSDEQLLTTRQTVKFQLLYTMPRLLNGVGFVLIAQSVLAIEPSMYIGLAATYILASIVGLLAIFVPGGLGVREAVIVAFASVYFPVEQAVVLALVARLIATVSDAGVALVYLALNNGRLKPR